MGDGAVWLHRKLLDSAIWTANDATRVGFVTCLLLANYKDQQWYSKAEHRQIVIARGSFFTTLEKFSALSRLSLDQTRNCFKILRDLNIITLRPTRRGTFVSIINYDEYQKVGTRKATDNTPQRPHNSPTIAPQLEEGKERQERKEGRGVPGFSVSEYVNGWKARPEWERREHAVEIAETLKKAGLGFRTQDEIFQQIMGGDNGTIRRKSIFEQAAERKRTGGLEKVGGQPGEILARVSGLPKIPPKTRSVDGGRNRKDDASVQDMADEMGGGIRPNESEISGG